MSIRRRKGESVGSFLLRVRDAQGRVYARSLQRLLEEQNRRPDEEARRFEELVEKRLYRNLAKRGLTPDEIDAKRERISRLISGPEDRT